MTGSTKQHTATETVTAGDARPGAHSSIIRSVSIRVAGGITTEAFAHHFGTTSQQVGVRAGDTLTYVHSHDTAVGIARAFSDGVAQAEAHGLRWSVSRTWLGVEPGTYPPTVMLRHTAAPATALGYQPQRAISGQTVPAHVWVRVGPVLWRVCDRIAADRLAHVWSSAARLLAPPLETVPTAPPARPARLAEPAPPRVTSQAAPGRPFIRQEASQDPRDDAALLAAYVEGDQEALATLVVRREAWVAAAVRRVLGSRGDVEDAIQNTWASVTRNAHAFEGRCAVRTWLWRIAHRAALDTLRRTPAAPLDCDVPETRDAYASADTAMSISDLLAVLPASQRAAVELVDMQGYDIAGAAALLKVAEGTVKSRCARGREALAMEWARRGLDQS